MGDLPSSSHAPRAAASPRSHRAAATLHTALSRRWLLTIASLLCATTWLLNLWVWLDLDTRLCTFKSAHGTLQLEWKDPTAARSEAPGFAPTWLSELPGYEFRHRLGFFTWWPRCGSFGSGSPFGTLWYFDLPLWIPAVACGVAGVAMWRRHWRTQARAAASACVSCGYDLTGLEAGSPCPECGR